MITKSRYSPFVETDIGEQLRAIGVEDLIVGGVGTSACVESTVRDARQREFRAYVVERRRRHQRGAHDDSFTIMGHLFGWDYATRSPRLRSNAGS